MPHYYSREQDSELNLKKINITLSGDSFELFSGSGVFSKSGLDAGTSLLIENAAVGAKARVLDLGCGIGVAGIALMRKHPEISVVMSDVNKRALMLARKNVEMHGFRERCSIVESDCFDGISESFDAILLNPPQTAGRDVCLRMIKGAREHLKRQGTLQLVARHNKGGKLLSERMKEMFGNMMIIARGSGFCVYASRK